MRSILVLCLLAAPALADNPAPKPAPAPAVPAKGGLATDDCARARAAGKTCVLNIGEEEITTDRLRHDDITVGSLVFNKLDSLLPIRRDFIKEIVRTAEDL